MSDPIPQDVADAILVKCGRCCCICRRFRPTKLQVHHIVPQSEDRTNDPDNLIALCITCHSDVHTQRPFTRRFSYEEQKQHRDAVFAHVADGKLVPPEDETAVIPPEKSANTSDAPTSEAPASDLVPEARKLLLVAADSHFGRITVNSGITTLITIDTQLLVTPGTRAREAERYKGGLEQLAKLQLIECVQHITPSYRIYQVTKKGSLAADEIAALV